MSSFFKGNPALKSGEDVIENAYANSDLLNPLSAFAPLSGASVGFQLSELHFFPTGDFVRGRFVTSTHLTYTHRICILITNKCFIRDIF